MLFSGCRSAEKRGAPFSSGRVPRPVADDRALRTLPPRPHPAYMRRLTYSASPRAAGSAVHRAAGTRFLFKQRTPRHWLRHYRHTHGLLRSFVNRISRCLCVRVTQVCATVCHEAPAARMARAASRSRLGVAQIVLARRGAADPPALPLACRTPSPHLCLTDYCG